MAALAAALQERNVFVKRTTVIASALCLALGASGVFAQDKMGKMEKHDKMGKSDKMAKKDKMAQKDKMASKDKMGKMDKMEKPGAMR